MHVPQALAEQWAPGRMMCALTSFCRAHNEIRRIWNHRLVCRSIVLVKQDSLCQFSRQFMKCLTYPVWVYLEGNNGVSIIQPFLIQERLNLMHAKFIAVAQLSQSMNFLALPRILIILTISHGNGTSVFSFYTVKYLKSFIAKRVKHHFCIFKVRALLYNTK